MSGIFRWNVHVSLHLVERQYLQRPKENVDSKFRNLADRNQVKVHTSDEQEILFKACLGYKKVQLCEEDKEDDLVKD